jgi:hypothetical protein
MQTARNGSRVDIAAPKRSRRSADRTEGVDPESEEGSKRTVSTCERPKHTGCIDTHNGGRERIHEVSKPPASRQG